VSSRAEVLIDQEDKFVYCGTTTGDLLQAPLFSRVSGGEGLWVKIFEGVGSWLLRNLRHRICPFTPGQRK
jgi:hypothetical protein